jgi:predicted metal-dependent enzyme (double-stranded beta helix superfamily)
MRRTLTGDSVDVTSYVTELATRTEALWAGAGRSPDSLPEVAATALAEVPAPTFTAGQLLAHFATLPTNELPTQSALNDNFGQPPVVLFAGSDFFIQALTWMEGTTAIHQHGFAGAFMVAEGQSLHVDYHFDLHQQVGPKLLVGDLEMGHPEILNPGDVRTIEPGSDFIHALFHLARPSVTIVVRNYSSEVGTPQFNYRRPGLAFAPHDGDVLRQRRLQALSALQVLEPDKASEAARRLLTNEDAWGAFQVTDHCFGMWGWDPRFLPILEVLADTHPLLGDRAAPMYQEQWRTDTVLKRRTFLHERHQRTFLALLANLPSREAVESVLGQLSPGRSSDEVLMEWIEELASPKLRGISGLTLTDEDLTALRSQLGSRSLTDSLGELSSKFGRSSILDQLISR